MKHQNTFFENLQKQIDFSKHFGSDGYININTPINFDRFGHDDIDEILSLILLNDISQFSISTTFPNFFEVLERFQKNGFYPEKIVTTYVPNPTSEDEIDDLDSTLALLLTHRS